MIQLLIVAAIVLGIIYYAVLGGNNKVEEKPNVLYQQEIERAKGLEQSIQQAADQKMRYIDQQSGQD